MLTTHRGWSRVGLEPLIPAIMEQKTLKLCKAMRPACVPLIFNTTTLVSDLRLQQVCLNFNRNKCLQEPEQELHVYSLGVIAFGWKHGAGGLSQSHLVGSGSDGRPRGGLKLPTKHRQLCLTVRGSGPGEELCQ